MDLQFSRRVALVAGGSRGIGRSIALALAKEGVCIALCARGADDLEKTAQQIQAIDGCHTLLVQSDLSTLEGCQRFVGVTVQQMGRADILVCCANVAGKRGAFDAIPDEQWVEHINVKLLSAVRCSREVVPHMKLNRWGRIVIIAGMATRLVRPQAVDNGPICAALTNFGKQLAAQVAADGICVNTIHPGHTDTPFLALFTERVAASRGVSPAEVRREYEAAFPRGRMIQPEEVANLAAFLCSDLAEAVTGQSIACDAGASISLSY